MPRAKGTAAASWHTQGAFRCLYTPANRTHLLKLIDMIHVNDDRYLRNLGLLRFQGRSQADHRALLSACAL